MHVSEIKVNLNEQYQQFVDWYAVSSYAGCRSLDDCPRWELREALSYYFQSTNCSSSLAQLAIAIKKAKNAALNLTLVEEALLQKELRLLGIDVASNDHWPDNTLDFQQYIDQNSSKVPSLKKINLAKAVTALWNYRYRYLLLTMLSVVIFWDWQLLLISLWWSHFAWALLEFVNHYYLEHRYVKPKNRLVQHLVEYFTYAWFPDTYLDKARSMRIHNYHHKYWKTNKDDFTKGLETYGFGAGLLNIQIFTKPNDKQNQRLLKEFSDFPWVIKYFIEIKIILSMMFIMMFGAKYFLYFFIIPWLLRGFFQYQHDLWFTIFGEKDHPWLFPLALHQAWHMYHHEHGKQMPKKWDQLFPGPKFLKYLNPQYYFGKLFFKLKV